jgi:hypothetical protein
MTATAKNGDAWTGEQPEEGWWPYLDSKGNRYESREVPEYRVDLRSLTHGLALETDKASYLSTS